MDKYNIIPILNGQASTTDANNNSNITFTYNL